MTNLPNFLRSMYRGVPDGFVELSFIHATSHAIHTRWYALPFDADTLNAMQAVVARENTDKCAYFGVTVRRSDKPHGKRGTKADALYLTALWCDLDKVTTPIALENTELKPTVIICTGGGFHGYWLLNAPLAITTTNAPQIERALKGIALATKGDTKVAELARVMRLPNTVNTKPERNRAACEITAINPVRYGYGEIEAVYAPYAPVPPLPVKRTLPVNADKELPRWITDYLASGAAQGERNKTLFVMACRLFDMGKSRGDVDSLLTPRGLADGLEAYEVERTITSAERAERKPYGDAKLLKTLATKDRILEQRGLG